MKYLYFSDIFEFQPKSKIKAGDGVLDGKYPFYTSSDTLTKSYDEYLFEGDSLIFGTGGKPSVHFNCDRYSVSTDCLVANPKRDKINSKYYYYFLKTNIHLLERGFRGAGLKHISKKYISDLKVPIVDIDVQNNVVDMLDKIERLIKKREESIQLLDEYLKSVFVEMFGDPVINEKGWNLVSIGQISSVRIGPFGSLLHREDYIKNGIPVINPSHMVSGKIYADSNFTISKRKYNELINYRLKCNDIILGRRGEIGRCGVVTQNEEGYLCGTGSMYIRPNLKSITSIFLVMQLNQKSMKKKLENKAVGVTMKNLNAKIVNAFEIILPPVQLQNKFVSIQAMIVERAKELTYSRDYMQMLFNALSQKYFEQ